MKNFFLIICLLLATLSFAQDMDPGFRMLETGQYTEAGVFFEKVLEEYPNNKTAQICYGRALGLQGNTLEAKALFTKLQQEYTGDFEVGLNYAESLLWNKDFDQALTAYQNLVSQQPDSFSALLGYANTLSNLKKYNLALLYVDKALHIQPENKNAAVSKKYMRLGKSAQLLALEQRDSAVILLRANLDQFPGDVDSQTALAGAFIAQKQFDKAHEAYAALENQVSRLIGQSLVAHLLKKESRALSYAEQALAFAKAKQPESKITSMDLLNAYERYIQALVWNSKYAAARTGIQTAEAELGSSNRLEALKATIGMYTGTFAKSIAHYRQILAQDSTSFDGNLGIANAFKAQGNLTLAREYALRTLEYYPNQPDAKSLLKSMTASLAPVLETAVAHTRDNGNNLAYATSGQLSIPLSTRFKTNFNFAYRTTENTQTQNMAYNTNAGIGADYRLLNNTWIKANIGVVKADAAQNDYTDVNGEIKITSRPWAQQYLEVGYGRALQNFNADLIDEKIFMNNYFLNYNMGTNIDLGWYTGLMHTRQTDGNQRNLLFTSLYYTFTKSPALKAGLNYQYLSFSEQVPELYFSPEVYQAAEVFADLSGKSGAWSYQINAAGGYQFIEQDPATTLFRFEANCAYTLSDQIQAGAYAKYSNIASATAAGFEFTEVGLKLRWQILNKPLFQF